MHAKHTCVMRWDTELVVCCTEVTAETLAKSPTLLLAARPLATVGTTAGVYVPGPTTAGVAARASKRGLLLNAIASGWGGQAATSVCHGRVDKLVNRFEARSCATGDLGG